MNRFVRCAVLFLACAFIAIPVFGQVDRGTINGTVTDESGGVLPGVNVTAQHLDTGVKTEAITNDLGAYTLPNLPIGRYRVSFGLSGFKTFERTEVTISVAQTLRIDARMQIGEISDTITIAANAELLNKDNNLIGTAIHTSIITDLPLSFSGGRSIENFAYALTPAVEGNNWTSYIAGGPAFSKEILIDGISGTSQIQGHIGESSPPMEAIEEFRVQTSGMSAEYGHTSGGVFNFSLRSGTNSPHGSAFYYLRNEAFNANSWMNNWRGVDRPRDRQNLGGGSLGGPVVIPGIYDGRNRTFVFGAFEHYEQQRLQLGPNNVTVPIPDFLNGNFSRLLTTEQIGTDALGRPVYRGQIFDPATLRQVDGKWVSDPFEGNIIPQNRMSPLSGKIIDIYRQQYQPLVPGVLTNNSARTQHNTPWFHQTQLTIKGDHQVSDANKLSGSLIWTQRPRILVDQGGVWNANDPKGTGGPFAKARKQEVTSRSLRMGDNHTFRPNLINTFAVAYNRYRNPSLSTEADANWGNDLGFGNSTSAGLFPTVNFGSAVNGVGMDGIGYGSSGFYVSNTYIVSNTLAWITGRHSFKFGGEHWRQQINSHAGLDVLQFGFSPNTTGIPAQPWSNQVGFGFASFFLGEVDSSSKNVTFDLYGRRNYVAFFVQDDFRATSNLTLNLGLRWEQTQPFYEKYGRWANFNPDIMNTNLGVKGALEFPTEPKDSFERNKDWKEFGPRFGAAYQLNNKMVLRGGYGIFYTPTGINYWSGVPYGFAPGFRGTNFTNSTGNVPLYRWDQGYAENFKAANKDPNTLIWGMVAIDPDSLKMGYTHQYNTSFQYSFATDMMAEVAFMGTQGRRLHNGALKRNQPTRADYENPALNPTAWVWDDASAKAAGLPGLPYPGFSYYAAGAIQPFPHLGPTTWGPLYYVGSPLGESGYRSLQFQLTRRMSAGVATQVSYNYSRSVGNGDTNFDETWSSTGGIQDMYDLKGDAKTIIGFDQTHILKGQFTFEMPFGRGRHFMSDSPRVLDAILGGWNVSTIFRYNSGSPMGISPNVWYPGWEGSVYANWDPSVDLKSTFDPKTFNPGQQNAPGNRYFNRAAFSNPDTANHKLGNGKRLYEELRGFGYKNEDIGLLKYVRFTESTRLQIRAELINVFNRHRFAGPGTSISNQNTFGNVTSATGDGRNVQMGLRLEF
jgi:hypothetical protein